MLKIIKGKSSKSTVVFLHGYLLSSEQWSKLALHRAPWRSVLIDLPYHGLNSGIELSEKSLDAYAEFVKNELAAAGIEQYSLVGHSMGGYIGLRLLQLDKNLDHLVLLHSNIWEDSPERKINRDRVAQVVKRSKSIFLREALPLLFKSPERHQTRIEVLIDTAMNMREDGIIHGALSMRDRKESHEIVRQQKQRCFFIQGSHDALIPMAEAQLIWEQVAHPNHFFVIPNCGHMSFIERPKILHKVLETIVAEAKTP